MIKIKLNRFSIFFFLYNYDIIFIQSTNQHWNVLEIKIIAVKNSYKQVVFVNLFLRLRNVGTDSQSLL